MLHEFIPAVISVAFLLVAFLYAFVSDPHRSLPRQAVAEYVLQADHTAMHADSDASSQAS
jgi:hypothetical protein